MMKNQFIKSVKESLKHWYLFLIVGILLIGTGIWTITSPVESYMALSTIFSLTFLISGIIEIVFAFLNKERIDNWGWTLVFGFLNALIGIMLLTNPLISATTLPIYVGFLIMFRSFGAIGTALDLKNYGNLEWGSLMLIGVISLFFSFFLIWNPLFTGISIIIWTGLALISSGIFNIYLSIKIRNIHKKIQKLSIE
jgi:uncharacterized membrane protein HdeD (DUF308 family)